MANSAPYFPFYADDWLDDERIFDMSLECEGAYIRILAAMWKRDGMLPDKENLCCNILRCRPAKWKKIRKTLLDSGVIQLENERLFNERLTQELQLFNEKSKKNVENANKRWSKETKTEPKKPFKNNESDNATALPAQCHTDTDTDTDIYKEKEKGKEKAPRKRFTPPTVFEIKNYMAELDRGDETEASRFFDFYESNGWQVGKNKMKSWPAAVRTWLARTEAIPIKPKPKKSPHDLSKIDYGESRKF